MDIKSLTSLEEYIKNKVTFWAIATTSTTFIVCLVITIYISFLQSETYLELIAASATKSFRQSILMGKVRESEAEISNAFNLQPTELVAIRDKDYKLIYEAGHKFNISKNDTFCKRASKVCWDIFRLKISGFFPIFYDEQMKIPFGYIEFIINPRFYLGAFLFLFCSVILVIVVQTLVISGKFILAIKQLAVILGAWAIQIKKNPKIPLKDHRIPFTDLLPMQEALGGLYNEIKQLENKAAEATFIETTKQVAHDLKSPLAALNVAISSDINLSEDRRVIIKASIQRINNIAIELLNKKPKTIEENNFNSANYNGHDVAALLKDLIREKEIEFSQYPELIVSFSSVENDVFCHIDGTDFQRALSNIINNAAEACFYKGSIIISIFSNLDSVFITVRDTGRGISEGDLPKLMNKGISIGKKGGHGLGLYHARMKFMEWGGTISIKSKLNEGTVVELSLPRTKNLTSAKAPQTS